jgi:hypothetical protein
MRREKAEPSYWLCLFLFISIVNLQSTLLALTADKVNFAPPISSLSSESQHLTGSARRYRLQPIIGKRHIGTFLGIKEFWENYSEGIVDIPKCSFSYKYNST